MSTAMPTATLSSSTCDLDLVTTAGEALSLVSPASCWRVFSLLSAGGEGEGADVPFRTVFTLELLLSNTVRSSQLELVLEPLDALMGETDTGGEELTRLLRVRWMAPLPENKNGVLGTFALVGEATPRIPLLCTGVRPPKPWPRPVPVGVIGGFPPMRKDGAVRIPPKPPMVAPPWMLLSPPDAPPPVVSTGAMMRALLWKRWMEPLPPMRKDCAPTVPMDPAAGGRLGGRGCTCTCCTLRRRVESWSVLAVRASTFWFSASR